MRKINCVVLLLIVPLEIYCQPKTINLNKGDTLFSLAGQYYYFDDVDSSFDIQEIIKLENQHLFQPSNVSIFGKPANNHTYWLKFTIRNYSDKEVYLFLSSGFIWFLDCYVLLENKEIQHLAESGLARTRHEEYLGNGVYAIKMINTKDSATVYLRMNSKVYLESFLQLGTQKKYYSQIKSYDYVFGIFLGAILITFGYNLFMIFYLGDFIYWIYMGYLATTGVAITFLNHYNLISMVSGVENELYVYDHLFLFVNPVFLFTGLFTLHFLEVKKINVIWHYLILSFAFVLSIFIPLLNAMNLLSLTILFNIFQVIAFLFHLYIVGLGFYLWLILRNPLAKYYSISWIWVVAGICIFLLGLNGWLPLNYFTRNVMFLGIGLQVLFFTFALGDRINFMRKEGERLQFENINLLSNQNSLVRDEVDRLTKELRIANEEILHNYQKLELQSLYLEDINRTKDQLFAIIGHDLKAPLNSLKSIMEMIKEKIIDKEELDYLIPKLHNDVENAYFLLLNLLNWARNQLQGIQFQATEICMYQLVENNLSLFETIGKEKDIKMINAVDKKCSVFADLDHIDIVVRNLISNALKFTTNGGKITVNSKLDDSFFVFSVIDSGVGIPEEYLEILFQSKVNKSTYGTNQEKGTGLGLALCKEFIELNKGRIWVESKIGQGSMFYFTLPVFE